MGGLHPAGLIAALIVSLAAVANSELTPPYFNLAEGRKISASSTCGLDIDGPELYCKLVGTHTDDAQNKTNFDFHDDHFHTEALARQGHVVIQGQQCDYCSPDSHPVDYAIDGSEKWWQSPPLSRGMKFNEVNLTIDFGQEFHVAYLFIRMGNSPRPGLWTLEKSSDYGKTWVPWQHFSDSPSDCEIYFGKDSLKPIRRDDDVICTTEFSKIVPLESGEIIVRLLTGRPSANNYFNSTTLQEWTRATNVRIRLLRTKNLLGHLMSVARQDPTVTRRYFYSIKDISIGGRCVCNGHANTCSLLNPRAPTRLLACACQHNTCGIQCEECCPGFEQKKWRQNTNAWPFQCEPCNCHGHSDRCVYSEEIDLRGESLDIHNRYEGGGVCQDCRHNTKGINCNQCQDKYYRPRGKHWNETDVCQRCDCEHFFSTGNCAEETGQCECRPQFLAPHCDECSEGYFGYPNCRPCECNLNGTRDYICEATDGKCDCKVNFGGDYCKQCAPGYFNFPECQSCECNEVGSIDGTCDETTGQCFCSPKYGGKHCDQCKDGYFDYPSCAYCQCDVHGTEPEICDKNSGVCLCKEGYSGARCDHCSAGYFNYPECTPCNCSSAGSSSTTCDGTGKCTCLQNFAGKRCDQCMTGFYQFPECLACNCDTSGAIGISCNADGQCNCHDSFDGLTCNSCKENYYNYPLCESCDCNPSGVIAKFAGCGSGSVPVGELCQCKERVQGRICDVCRPLYWNLNASNPDGCEECDCFIDGTIGALDTCDSKSGQCSCKQNVQSRKCDECVDGTFDLFGASLFGCKPCDCDIGGSASHVCHKETGECRCHPRITGRDCTRPLQLHYYPTLYQFKFEYEDGSTSTGAQVRYQFDEHVFPDFSKIGYAVTSQLQSEITNEINIQKSSFYQLIIRFVNPTNEPIIADILIQSENTVNPDQEGKVLFKPTKKPEFVTMSGAKGDVASPIVLDPGQYNIVIKSDQTLFLDYFVLLPAAYYEASILTRQVVNPCRVDKETDLCRLYKYPSIEEYTPITKAHTNRNDGSYEAAEFYRNFEHLSAIGEPEMPVITPSQFELNYVMHVARPGRYVLVVDYITDTTVTDTGFLAVNQDDETEQDGMIVIYPCVYQMVCRGPVMDKDSREKVFFIDNNDKPTPIVINGENVRGVAIKSVTPIPYEQWTADFVQPRPVCVLKNGACVESSFATAPDTKKIELESDQEERVAVDNLPDIASNGTKVVYLNKDQQTVLVTSKVTEPGRYVAVVKYYQPNHPKFNIIYRLETERQNYDGKFALEHCPSTSGCRGVLRQDSGFLWFEIDDSLTFSFTNLRDKGVWLDYILLVPIEYYTERLLVEEEFDQTAEFLKECGQDHFNIQLNASDFCKTSVFSLTAEYNVGNLPCACDSQGSQSFECEQFGGQCQCKANIIGRQCEACKTGFYGFPDCKPCDCPSTAICEKRTGECICPPRVTGEKCDQCVPYTFGFDQIIGCEECNCNEYGVHRGNLQCDLNNGSCVCASNVVGRSCDKCSYGFWRFPECESCRCDLRGTTLEVCDQDDETCFCKKNVQGRECNYCSDGTYNLQEKNPDGCTKCFCFGKTTRCENAYLREYNVSMLNNVTLHTINVKTGKWNNTNWLTEEPLMLNDTSAQVVLGDVDNPELLDGYPYFGMLEEWDSQNRYLTAYGGFLRYSLFYTTNKFGKSLIGPDVILEGKDLRVKHMSYQQPAANQVFHGAVEIIESNFQLLSGVTVSREQFMAILRDLKKIYIRASYFDNGNVTYLSDVVLSLADDDADNYHLYKEVASEKCECPPGYAGLSCQDCANGYYRDPNGPYGGYCVPCDCNGHAETCNCDTGICDSCQHNTIGDHCDMCVEGYYGNATFGTPYDCMICACPLPVDSNNFAFGCDVSPDGYSISCDCKPGYTGHKCQSCSNGFYGRPEHEGEICKPCECSGNIDPSIPGSCDSVTGECIHCLNNTFGAACNLCAPGFYGEAIGQRCQSCICDNIGTYECDNYSGKCVCLPNVIGEKCDLCADDHYGFDSGYGCAPCECGVASNSTQCDDHSGECACKPGVGGRQCERCLPGYYNYGPDGCIPCSCNTELSKGLGCNPVTGQCECLHQVIGEKCDSCPPRWVFIENYGCEECDGCHHGLLDVTDALKRKIDPVVSELNTVAKSFYTTQKLKRLNEETEELKPQVENLDPKSNNLSEQIQEIESLEQDVASHEKKSKYLKEKASELSKASDELLKTINEDKSEYRSVAMNARNTISEVNTLANSLDTDDKNTRLDQTVKRAEEYLDQIKAFDPKALFKGNQKEPTCKADIVFADVKIFAEPVSTQKKRLDHFKDAVEEFNKKIDDLREKSRESQMKAILAGTSNKKNKDARLPQKLEKIMNFIKESKEALKSGKSNEIESKKLLANFDLALKEADSLYKEIDELNKNVDIILPKNEDDYNKLKPRQQEVLSHVMILSGKKDNLSNQYSNITANSNDAIKAANAYSEIVNNVDVAKNSSNSAHTAATDALDLTGGMGERAAKSHRDSSDLYKEGHSSLSDVQLELNPKLQKALVNVKDIGDEMKTVASKLDAINDAVSGIKPEPLTDTWSQIQDDAVNSDALVKQSAQILEPITDKLQQSSDLSKKLPSKVEDTNKDILQALGQVQRVSELVPNILGVIDELEEKQGRLDSLNSQIGDDLERLRRQVEQARALANSIKVGVAFQPNTILELKTPENLQSQTFNTRVSAFFKTANPNGLLLFLGNEPPQNGVRGKRDDFMAIEIENGYPVLSIDVGDGPERIISQKKVDDDRWYEAIVERTGKAVTFTIREEDDDGNEKLIVRKEELPGDQTNFNLDEKSRLFVGGHSDVLPDSIKQSSFEGEIEGVKIGEHDVGLWNFVDANNNQIGAAERDRLVTKEAKHTGYRFGGNGFVILDAKPYSFKQRSHVSFKFKADKQTPSGLLFFVGHKKHYVSLELRDGFVHFQFKMGQNTQVAEIKSKSSFNDGEWHTVEATRDKGEGGLSVDGFTIYQETVFIADSEYQPPERMYFGGYPDRPADSDVTAKYFDGCIDEAHIDGTPIDLTRNIQSQDVLPGCPMKFSSVVSFAHNKHGYLRSRNLAVNNKLHINLKFKTQQSKGVIFFGMNNDQSGTISLALEDGILILRSSKYELNTDTRRFNDGQWHVVTVEHDAKKLRISIDDTYEYKSEEAPPVLMITYGDIYFGGLPKYFTPVQGALPNDAYFVGCIMDVTINAVVVNFASSTDKSNAILNSCPRDILDYNLLDVPHYYPDGKVEPIIDSRFSIDENEITEEKEDKIGGGRGPEMEKTTPSAVAPTTLPTTTERTRVIHTTEAPVTTPRPKPIYTEDQKHPLCVLPVIPDYDVDFDSAGYRFGTSPNTFVELESPAELPRSGFEFSLWFRTQRQNGLIFTAVDGHRGHSVTLSIRQGYLNFEVACSGSNPVLIVSKNQYDNNEWNFVELSKNKKTLTLTVQEEVQTDQLKCMMEMRPRISIGGTEGKADPNQFFGCIKDVKQGVHILKPGSNNPPSEGVLPCSDNIESGVFFGKSGGVVKLRDKFKVGRDLTISMDIKPRNVTGVLTSVHGKKSFFIVEMIKGSIHFTVDSGDGPRSTVFTPDADKSLCDGQWHTVTVIKSRFIISINVDKFSSEPNVGNPEKHTDLETTRPLFLGGHPHLAKIRGIKGRHNFQGCIRNFKINGVEEIIKPEMTTGNVETGVCPQY